MNSDIKKGVSRIGVYGGSFDPIHNGHLILAREAMEQLQLDRVIFIPTAISPHKLEHKPAAANLRLQLVRAAIEGEPGFDVDDCEIVREGVSYSIDTIRSLKNRFPDAEFFYLIGDDNLPGLSTWREIETLKQIVQFVVLRRGAKQIATEFPVIERRIDISSTDIRKRVARGHSVHYLLPDSVCKLLHQSKLYSRPESAITHALPE